MWPAGFCGERACPRWAAQQPQHLTAGFAWHSASTFLGALRTPTRASPLATGYWVALRTLNRPTTGSLPSKSNTGAVTRSNSADTFAANGV